MIYPDRENFSYLQVDRPIMGGADAFLVRAAEIARRAVGTQSATSLAETHADTDEVMNGGELTTTLRTLSEERVQVFRANELRMILLRRVVPDHMSRSYNLSAKATAFTNKRSLFSKHAGNASRSAPSRSIVEQIDGIARGFGEDPTNTGLVCDRVTEIHDPIFGHALGLAPQPGQGSTWTLGLQAEESFAALKKMSPKFAYTGGPWMPIVPFASLPADLKPVEYMHLEEGLNEVLTSPVRLVMGAVAAYNGSALGNISEV